MKSDFATQLSALNPVSGIFETYTRPSPIHAIPILRPDLIEAGYLFEGKHFLASYSGCDIERLTDVEGVLNAMRRATLASGATILNESHHVFPPHGLTAMLLLSESHASIHTYPEHGSCFVDLFTCGDRCNCSAFHELMVSYLQATDVQAKTILRNTDIQELLE